MTAQHVYTEMNDLTRITGYKDQERKCQFAIFRLFHLIGAVATLFLVSLLLLNTYSFYHIDNYKPKPRISFSHVQLPIPNW
jgi:hypothetical protein